MKTERKTNPIERELKSFANAFRGIGYFLKEERHGRFHIIATVLVILLGLYVDLNKFEWLFITFSIGLVIIIELVNTTIENLIDYLAPQRNEMAGKIKDLAAGAVLLSAILAIAIGLIIFIPKLT